MTFARYALGVGALFCVLGSLGSGAFALRRSVLPEWRGAPARLAEIVLCLALLVLTLELLGAVGLLRFAPIVVVSGVVGLGLRAWLRRTGDGRPSASSVRVRWHLPTLLAFCVSVVGAGFVLAEWAGPTLQSYTLGIRASDSISYHLPWAASFAQTGQITGIRYTDFEWLTGFYPATSELLHAFGIVLMGNDILSPAINFLWVGLVLLAAWCMGAPRGVGPATLLGGALVMATPMMFFSTAGTADSDAAATFFLLAAVALLINLDPWRQARAAAASPEGLTISELSLPPMVLLPAAAAAGLAISVKLNVVPPALILTVAAIAYFPRHCRRRYARVWLATLAITGGFWYLRNLFAVGNPLPYFSFGVLPTPQPPPTQAHNNFRVTDYLTYPHVLSRYFGPGLARGLGPWWTIILIVAIASFITCIFCRRDRVVRYIGFVAFASLAAYTVTPGSASGPWGSPHGFALNLRYIAPALIVATTALPLATPMTGPRVRLPVMGVLTAILAATIAQDRLWEAQPAYNTFGQVVGAVLLLCLVAVMVVRPAAKARLRRPVARLALLTALALAFTGIAFGYTGQRHYLRQRYSGLSGLHDMSDLWAWSRHIRHQRIALAGTFGWFFAYPLYGPDDSNRLVFLAHHFSNGAFRPFTSCPAWRQAVNAGHFAYVVATATRVMWTGRIRFSPEGRWTRTDPAARLLFPAGGTRSVEVFAIKGRLSPRACASLRDA